MVDRIFGVFFALFGLFFLCLGLLMAVGQVPSFNAWSDVLGVLAGFSMFGLSWGLISGTAFQVGR